MHRKPTWVVIRYQNMRARNIHAHMNGPCLQRNRLTNWLQGSRLRVNAEGAKAVQFTGWHGCGSGGRSASPSVTPDHIEILSRGVRPSILNVRRKPDGGLLYQQRIFGVEIVFA